MSLSFLLQALLELGRGDSGQRADATRFLWTQHGLGFSFSAQLLLIQASAPWDLLQTQGLSPMDNHREPTEMGINRQALWPEGWEAAETCRGLLTDWVVEVPEKTPWGQEHLGQTPPLNSEPSIPSLLPTPTGFISKFCWT